jgi:hypothetical protein
MVLFATIASWVAMLLMLDVFHRVYGWGVILDANQEMCVFETINVTKSRIHFFMDVEEGGQFDVAYTIADPDKQSVLSSKNEKGADVVFVAEKLGEYCFCISNRISSFTNKLVIFDIVVMEPLSNDDGPLITSSKQLIKEQDPLLPSIQQKLVSIKDQIHQLALQQRYIKARERRNYTTIKNIRSMIFWLLTLGCFLIICLSALQVYLVRVVFLRHYRGKTRTI